jgi:hypothetical protein
VLAELALMFFSVDDSEPGGVGIAVAFASGRASGELELAEFLLGQHRAAIGVVLVAGE